MKNKKVTVIIPVYNTKKYLETCVNSVIEQTYKNLQIILVDDGSTDGSSSICDRLGKKDFRVEVLHKANEGQGIARNKGLKYAKGEYVCFLDSDDCFELKHIENLVQAFEENKADIVIGSYTKCKYNGNHIEKFELYQYGVFSSLEIKNKIMLSLIAADSTSSKDLGLPMSVCFSLYSMDIIRENNLKFNSERIIACEDLFFNLNYLYRIKKAVLIKEFGYKYRFNPHSTTKEFDEKQIERMEKLHFELVDFVNKMKLNEEALTRIYRCDLAKLRTLLFMIVRSNKTYFIKRKKMKELLNKEIYIKALKEFSISNYRVSLKLTTYLMKFKMIDLLYLVLLMKEKSVNRT